MGMTFISFLGTSSYQTVRYRTGEWESAPTKYIQVAIASLYCRELTSPDSIRVLMTNKAKAQHWDIEGGLKSSLSAICRADSLDTILIPDLVNEDDLWKIFDILYSQIPDEGEIVLDITHGFRSIPLLASIVIDYARTMKRIKVRGIHYAAIEAQSEGVVPIIDLTRLDRLFRWTRATELFVRRGDASGIEGLLGEQAKEVISARGSPSSMQAERRLASSLKESFDILSTVRGKEIITGAAFLHAQNALAEMEKDTAIARPMVPLYDLMLERVKAFRPNSMGNLLLAVDLCIKYGLVQQGITLLQESIITIILHSNGQDYQDRTLREAVSKYFAFLNEPQKYKNSLDDPKIDPEIASILETSPLFSDFVEAFERLRKVRNNINHAEFTNDSTDAIKFPKTLKVTFHSVLEVLSKDREYQFVCSSLLGEDMHEE